MLCENGQNTKFKTRDFLAGEDSYSVGFQGRRPWKRWYPPTNNYNTELFLEWQHIWVKADTAPNT